MGHVAGAGGLLDQHDILLLSSHYEGVPAAVAEALAAGIGVIATDCGPGVRGLSAQGSVAQLVAPTLDALATAIRDATAPDPAKIEAALLHVRKYAIEETATCYLAEFATLRTVSNQAAPQSAVGGFRV